jgi:hypothetical protein
MPEYRAYLIGPDDHIVKRVELVCTDEVAREQAKTLAEWHDSGFKGRQRFHGAMCVHVGTERRAAAY